MDLTARLVAEGFKVRRVDRIGAMWTVWLDDAPVTYKTYEDHLQQLRPKMTCLGFGLRLDADGVYRSYVRVREG